MQSTNIYLFSILLLGIVGCNASSKTEIKASNSYCLEGHFKNSLEWIQATKSPIMEGIHLTGTVDANPDQVVHFKSLFSGIVVNTYFSLGDKVQKGQLLAEIQSAEYSTLLAESKSVSSQIEVAEVKLASVKKLFTDGFASQRDVNEVRSELDILRAEEAKITSNRNLYSASNSKNVFQIKAPATGIITAKQIANGMQISGENDEVLFTISNLENVWVMANIYASNLQHVQEGMEVEIRTISYPDRVFKGKISVISQMLDEASKVLKARIVLDNNDLILKPGMLADIIVTKKQGGEAISIPASELIFSDNQNYVLVYKNDCDIEIRPITILTKNHTTVYVSEGLHENEKVISKNQLLIFQHIRG